MRDKVSVGLDVGNGHINMVKLTKDSSGLRLIDYACVSLSPWEGKKDQLKQLERVVQDKGLSQQPVNVGVSGESVIVRYLDFPRMSKKELTQALKYEAQQYIPFRIEEVIFDAHILGAVSSDKEKMRVLLVAAKRQMITEFVEFIQQAGLRPRLIDVSSFALINCFRMNSPKITVEQVCALINLEFDLVNVNILQGEMPYFTRDISLLEDVLGILQEKDKSSELFKALQPLLANLIRELCLSLDYYESEFEQQVNTIYLSGEGAGDSELVNFFSNRLGRQINLWNPLENLAIDAARVDAALLKKRQGMLALACGLALRGAV